MSCCKKECDNTSGNTFTASYAFIVLILFILLAIIWVEHFSKKRETSFLFYENIVQYKTRKSSDKNERK